MGTIVGSSLGFSFVLSICGINIDLTSIWKTVEIMQIVNMLRFLNSPMTSELREFFISCKFANLDSAPNAFAYIFPDTDILHY